MDTLYLYQQFVFCRVMN